MPRKTVNVRFVVNTINHILQLPDSSLPLSGNLPGIDSEEPLTPAQAYRFALAGLLESVLHETDTYGGFTYLTSVIQGPDDNQPADQTHRIYGTHRVLTNG